ncbi:MAG: hypothetical protein ACM3WV_04145, partial [Bacillota bacterium]
WLAFQTTNAWIAYQFGGGASYAITEYTITSANDAPERDPRDWRLQGSNDGINWTTVDTRTGQSFGSRYQTLTYSVGGAINPTPTPTPSSSAAATPTGTPTQVPVTDRYMGINIEHAHDSGNLKIFANCYLTCRLGTPDNPNGGGVSVDSNNNPTSDFGIMLWDGAFLKDTRGTYKLSFNGKATISGVFGIAVNNAAYNSSTNTTTADLVVEGDASCQFKCTATQRTAASPTNTGVTNIKIMRPISPGSSVCYDPSTIFTTPFKNIIQSNFKAIRFMDFTATNGKLAEVNWSDRVKPYQTQQSGGNGYGWQGKGAAWEYVARLCNETNTDCWICVPVAVTDDYITKLAQLFKYGSNGDNPYTSPQSNPVWAPLNSNLKLYIEYANELWNFAGAFTQSGWNKDKAVAEVNAGGSNLNYDGETGTFQWGWRRVGKRTVEISKIFRSIFGDAEMMTRIRPVIEWQQGNGQGTAGLYLDFVDKWYNNGDGYHVLDPHPIPYYIWGGSGSAYYNPDGSSDGLTLSNIWTSQTFNTANWAKAQEIDAGWAYCYGLRKTAYEGGPSMDNTGHSEAVKEQAWNDSRMKTCVADHQVFWEQYGGDVLMYLCFSGSSVPGYYQWEFVKNMNDPINTSPKMQAIDSLKSGTKAAATVGIPVPATFKAAAYAYDVDYDSHDKNADSINIDRYNSRNYLLRASNTGSRTITVQYSSGSSVSLRVLVNGTDVGRLNLNNTGGSQATSNVLTFNLNAGLNGIRIQCLGGSATLYNITIN